MIALLLIWLEGMFNAVMDCVCDEPAFNKSKFKDLNPKFWRKDISAKYAKNFPGTTAKMDAWHGAKFLQLLSFGSLFIVALFWPQISIWPLDINWVYLVAWFPWWGQLISFLILLCLYGLFRNFSFNLHFNKLFRAVCSQI